MHEVAPAVALALRTLASATRAMRRLLLAALVAGVEAQEHGLVDGVWKGPDGTVMMGNADFDLSMEDVCVVCQSAVHRLLKVRKPGQMVFEALAALCKTDNFKAYPLFPPSMVKGCRTVLDFWDEDDEAFERALKAKGHLGWHALQAEHEVCGRICAKHQDVELVECRPEDVMACSDGLEHAAKQRERDAEVEAAADPEISIDAAPAASKKRKKKKKAARDEL